MKRSRDSSGQQLHGGAVLSGVFDLGPHGNGGVVEFNPQRGLMNGDLIEDGITMAASGDAPTRWTDGAGDADADFGGRFAPTERQTTRRRTRDDDRADMQAMYDLEQAGMTMTMSAGAGAGAGAGSYSGRSSGSNYGFGYGFGMDDGMDADPSSSEVLEMAASMPSYVNPPGSMIPSGDDSPSDIPGGTYADSEDSTAGKSTVVEILAYPLVQRANNKSGQHPELVSGSPVFVYTEEASTMAIPGMPSQRSVSAVCTIADTNRIFAARRLQKFFGVSDSHGSTIRGAVDFWGMPKLLDKRAFHAENQQYLKFVDKFNFMGILKHSHALPDGGSLDRARGRGKYSAAPLAVIKTGRDNIPRFWSDGPPNNPTVGFTAAPGERLSEESIDTVFGKDPSWEAALRDVGVVSLKDGKAWTAARDFFGVLTRLEKCFSLVGDQPKTLSALSNKLRRLASGLSVFDGDRNLVVPGTDGSIVFDGEEGGVVPSYLTLSSDQGFAQKMHMVGNVAGPGIFGAREYTPLELGHWFGVVSGALVAGTPALANLQQAFRVGGGGGDDDSDGDVDEDGRRAGDLTAVRKAFFASVTAALQLADEIIGVCRDAEKYFWSVSGVMKGGSAHAMLSDFASALSTGLGSAAKDVVPNPVELARHLAGGDILGGSDMRNAARVLEWTVKAKTELGRRNSNPDDTNEQTAATAAVFVQYVFKAATWLVVGNIIPLLSSFGCAEPDRRREQELGLSSIGDFGDVWATTRRGYLDFDDAFREAFGVGVVSRDRVFRAKVLLTPMRVLPFISGLTILEEEEAAFAKPCLYVCGSLCTHPGEGTAWVENYGADLRKEYAALKGVMPSRCTGVSKTEDNDPQELDIRVDIQGSHEYLYECFTAPKYC